MIYDCPTCAAALRFNPSLGKMICLNCGNTYDVEDVTDSEESAVKADAASEDTMQCNIYSCTSCGAKLAVNGVETSTFCSYCGQPTIVFDRVSSAAKPKYIIPFSVSKNQAVSAIRSKLTDGFFVPDEIKDFEVERIRGIYIPYWLYDVDYYDRQYLKGDVGSGKHKRTKYFYREAECTFRRLTLDASIQLNDESSQRLEPFDTSALKPFDVGYLSGFYADCYDTRKRDLDALAVSRSMEYFNKEVAKSIRASNIGILSSNPQTRILKAEYAMFPVWFLTFRYQDEPYTILVNGQTGKVIGAVPYEKKKVTLSIATIGILATILSNSLIREIINDSGQISGDGVLVCVFGAFWILSVGLYKFMKIKNSIALSKFWATNEFVKNRQEGE